LDKSFSDHREVQILSLSSLLAHDKARGEASGGVEVKALCYKPEGSEFVTRRGEFLNLPNPSGRTRPWGILGL
jgi:hypothetical protein